MSHLYEVLARRVDKWRADGYPADGFPAIGEIFEWASDPDTGNLRYLRRLQDALGLRSPEIARIVAGRPLEELPVLRVGPQLDHLDAVHFLQPKIDDWRAMVDCVLIDLDYDGQVFRIGLSDIPERKMDLVAGRYEVPVGRGQRTVAVKLIDMLGEEVLTTHSLPAAGN